MKELFEIVNELHAPKNNTNTFAGFQYRTTDEILSKVKPLLHQHECILYISTSPTMVGDWHYIEAKVTIVNKNGDSVSVVASAREPEHKTKMDDAQVTGTSTTYAKKTALCNLFSIDDSSDDPDITSGQETNANGTASNSGQQKPTTGATGKTTQPKGTVEPKHEMPDVDKMDEETYKSYAGKLKSAMSSNAAFKKEVIDHIGKMTSWSEEEVKKAVKFYVTRYAN